MKIIHEIYNTVQIEIETGAGPYIFLKGETNNWGDHEEINIIGDAKDILEFLEKSAKAIKKAVGDGK